MVRAMTNLARRDDSADFPHPPTLQDLTVPLPTDTVHKRDLINRPDYRLDQLGFMHAVLAVSEGDVWCVAAFKMAPQTGKN